MAARNQQAQYIVGRLLMNLRYNTDKHSVYFKFKSCNQGFFVNNYAGTLKIGAGTKWGS